jgi:hypothetical protein
VNNRLTLNCGIRLEREEQPADGQLRSERRQPAQQPGEPARSGHRAEAADSRRSGSNMSWGSSGNALININQLDPK